MQGIKNVLNITLSGCFIVQQAFVGERKAAAEGPLNALQSSLEYIKLTCVSDLPPEPGHERFPPLFILAFSLLSVYHVSKQLSMSLYQQWTMAETQQSISTDSVAKKTAEMQGAH